MLQRINLRMQTIVLLALIPALVGITAVYGWLNYKDLSQTIVRGFDQKLFAASTTSASFVDGDEHARVLVKHVVGAITFDALGETLYGLDTTDKMLVKIDTSTGAATAIAPIQTEGLHGMTYVPDLDALVSIRQDERGQRLVQISVSDGLEKNLSGLSFDFPDKDTESPVLRDLTYNPNDKLLYAVGDELYRIQLNSGKAQQIGALNVSQIQGLSWDAQTTRLLGIDSQSGMLLQIDTSDASIQELGVLDQSESKENVGQGDGHAISGSVAKSDVEVNDTGEVVEADQWVEPAIIVLPARGLALSPDGSQAFATTDRLVRVDSKIGKGDPNGFLVGYRNEASELYLKIVEPMRRVLKTTGLTYHYTSVPFSKNHIWYVVDATEGDVHSAIGTEEENPDDEAERLNKVIESGQADLSDIQQFDIWGLLKIGTAPIFNKAGEVTGLMGADVNVSIINRKTRIAMLQILGAGALSVLLAIVVSFSIARRLIDPVNKLRDGALRIAAGQYDREIKVKGPIELKSLAHAFNQIGLKLKDLVRKMGDSSQKFELHRREMTLARRIEERSTRESDNYSETMIEVWSPRNARPGDVSGWVAHEGKVLLWFAQIEGDSLLSSCHRAEIHKVCGSLLQQYSDDWEQLSARLRPLFKDSVQGYVLLDPDQKKVHSLSRESAQAALVDERAATKTCELLEHNTLDLGPGQMLVLSKTNSMGMVPLVQSMNHETKLDQEKLDVPSILAVMRA